MRIEFLFACLAMTCNANIYGYFFSFVCLKTLDNIGVQFCQQGPGQCSYSILLFHAFRRENRAGWHSKLFLSSIAEV